MARTFARRPADTPPERASRPASKSATKAAPARSRQEDSTDEDDADSGERFKKGALRPGWGGAKKMQEEHSTFAARFKFTEDPQIVKFIDDAPFETYAQHWIERSGKQGFVCLEDRDDRGCPLCDIGDRARILSLFNIAVLDADVGASIKVLSSGPRLTESLAKRSEDRATSPLSKPYWAFSKSGKGAKTTHKTDPVKARDLQEDWSVAELTDEEIEALDAKRHDFEDVETSSPYKELVEIAEEYTGGE